MFIEKRFFCQDSVEVRIDVAQRTNNVVRVGQRVLRRLWIQEQANLLVPNCLHHLLEYGVVL